MTRLLAGVLDPQGPAAREIDDLWWLMLVLGTAVFVLFAVLLVVGFRRQGDEAEPGEETKASPAWLYGGGVALPVVGIGAVLVATLVVMQGNPETVAADEDGARRAAGGEEPVVVEAVASQFWWEFRYPGEDVVTASELHIPAGEPIQLRIEATDVIHSFWVPELAGKRDALPGNTTFLVIEADEPGRWRGQCAEFCGLGHALMEVQVVAHPRAEYEEWLAAARRPAAEPAGAEARRGQQLFLQHCAECHTVRGTGAEGDQGPDLTHFASRDTLASGALENTADDLRRWLHDPADVKAGTTMPAADLPDEDLAAIVAYLRGLE